MKNRLKEVLRSGKPAIGTMVQLPNPSLVEIVVQAGFDMMDSSRRRIFGCVAVAVTVSALVGPPTIMRIIVGLCVVVVVLALFVLACALLLFRRELHRGVEKPVPVSLSFHAHDLPFVEEICPRLLKENFTLCCYDPSGSKEGTVGWYAEFFFHARAMVLLNPRRLANNSAWVDAEIRLARTFGVPLYEITDLSELDAVVSAIKREQKRAFHPSGANLDHIAHELQEASDRDGLSLDIVGELSNEAVAMAMAEEGISSESFLFFLPAIVALYAGFIAAVSFTVAIVVAALRISPLDIMAWVYTS